MKLIDNYYLSEFSPNKIVIVVVIFCVLGASCTSEKKKDSQNFLIGTWHEVKVVRADGVTNSANGKPFKANNVFKITEDTFTYVFSPENRRDFKYSLKDNVIIMNKMSFKIEKNTSDSLILSDYTSNQSNEKDGFIHYFLKQKEN